LQANAELAGDGALFLFERRIRIREIVGFDLFALVAEAHQHVGIPAATFLDEVIAGIERDAVLAPVQVLVVVEIRILVVQFGVERPVRIQELADTDGTERRIAGFAVVVLHVEASGTGQVPAVVELLRVGGLRHAQTAQQCGTEEFLVHWVQLLDHGEKQSLLITF
jgi:hypothetical protein